jgi:hypothetical protein
LTPVPVTEDVMSTVVSYIALASAAVTARLYTRTSSMIPLKKYLVASNGSRPMMKLPVVDPSAVGETPVIWRSSLPLTYVVMVPAVAS